MITEEDIEHISWLARIKLTDTELDDYTEKINPILEYFNTLDDIKENVAATYHILNLDNVFREDEASDMLSQGEALSNAEKTKNGYFKSARIV
jgi:aspartyl-tRNA(Asn)/glutamyl-tRNA(Gln) amidotransferase subunit C